MGLTARSTGRGAADSLPEIKKQSESDRLIAIAGNPNVGKSTLFNSLTGMHQHTGNWPGKTVTSACGSFRSAEHSYTLVDIPGTYSLMAHSAEEEVARDFICFGGAEAAVVVCDATCLERSLNLALQVMEICRNTIICVNLMDEAERKNITIDLEKLERELGVPVVGTTARSKRSLQKLTEILDGVCGGRAAPSPRRLRYIQPIEQAIAELEPHLCEKLGESVNSRWLALRLLEGDSSLTEQVNARFGTELSADGEISGALRRGREILARAGITSDNLKDRIVSCIVLNAEEVCDGAVSFGSRFYDSADRRADRILTGRLLGYPVMILLLLAVFWLTISGANYPSQLLAEALFWLGDRFSELLAALNAPEWLSGLLADGAYRTLAWVTSVMLPPMAIFFPLFTLLEDSGYLPRVAYNLDRPFKKCSACGKQALTMCMEYTIL